MTRRRGNTSQRRPLVLLVEDEVGTQDALATLLRMDGWDVDCAYDGEEAHLVLDEEHQRAPL